MSRVVNVTTTSVLKNGNQCGVESTIVLGPRCGKFRGLKEVRLEPGMHLLTRSKRILGQITVLQKVVSIKGDVVTMIEVPDGTWPAKVVAMATDLTFKVSDLYNKMLDK